MFAFHTSTESALRIFHLEVGRFERRSEKMELEFYDVKTKSKFKSSDFDVREKESKGRKRFFAVTKSPAGSHECWRVLSQEQAEKLK